MPLPNSGIATDDAKESAAGAHAFPAADLEHPWLGLESFREETRAYFFGRDAEVNEIHLRLRSHPLLVLYGRSGLGKTSILSAGLIPRLRDEGQRPALHRLKYEAEGPFEQLFALLFDEGERSPVQRFLRRKECITAWETDMAAALARPLSQQKDSPGLVVPFSFPQDPASRLWLRLHWRKKLPNITHLILDQFEEVFTLGAQQAGAENKVRDALAILLQGSIPDPIVRLIAEHDDFLDYFDSDCTPVRVLLALRADYVYALNRWKRTLPSLGQNTFELRALRGPAALDAVFKPGALRCRYRGEVSEENKTDTGLPPIVTTEAAERIVRFVAKKGDDVLIDEIEAVPPILSLLCRELNERRFAAPAGTAGDPVQQITFSRSDTDVETIVKSFYERCMARRPDAVRTFIEEGLVSYSGARLAQDEKSILSAFERGWRIPGAPDGQPARGYGDPVKARTCLEELVNKRLLTSVAGGENRSYELIHDLLAGVVEKSRLTREALAQAERLRLEQVAQRHRQHVTTAVACVLAAALIGTLYGGYYAFVQEHREYYREFSKRHGFPVGIFRISEAEARRLPVSFRFVNKGIVHDGWKVHWKPAFRVEAANGHLNLSTNHSVFPYLWKGENESKSVQDKTPSEKGERLRLSTVCQWEFVSTGKGEIIYERALDRAGRMVYGLVYSPPGSSEPGTRLARIVGPNGFPQFQRRSDAEYVKIFYDKEGWEDRIMYRNGKNLPAAGPDGAFGETTNHNFRGQVICLLSLDEKTRAMIDNAGNSGMQTKYDDEKGYAIEAKSVGPDYKPMPLKHGVVVYKYEYDGSGRVWRTRYYGIDRKPVKSKEDGSYGWETQYDEHGDATSVTYVDLDGKPTLSTDGYAIRKMVYDGHSNVLRMTFYDVKNGPALSKDNGSYGWESKYDENDNETVLTYLGFNGKPTRIADGYATRKMAYDAGGNVMRTTYYDVNGVPARHKDGNYGWEGEYDAQGNKTVQTYLDLDGKPMSISDGYAVMRMSYDADGNVVRQTFYDVKRDPALSKKNSSYGWETEYDKQGNATVQTYLGPDGKPVSIPDGYATMKWAYDAHGDRVVETYLGLDGKPKSALDGYATKKMAYDASGNVMRMMYYDVNGVPVRHKDGNYGWEGEYDEQGNKTVQTYLDLDGKPMSISDGYAVMKMAYDTDGNVIRQTFYDVKGDPALSEKNSSHGWETEYDKQGNATVQTYLGLDDKPMSIPDGYAKFKSTYDSQHNVIRETYYGVNGEPVRDKDGYHGWKYEYNDKNKRTVETSLGLDGKPTLNTDGYATLRMAYDTSGNVIRKTFYGVNDEPVRLQGSSYGQGAEYDENGNVAAVTYLGLDGKPMSIPNGYAKFKSTYDSQHNVIRETYYGVNGEPVRDKDGYHGWEYEYDDKGKQTVETSLGLDGKPTPNTDGYATLRMAYDASGNVIRETFYGVNGEPVRDKDGYHGWEYEYDDKGRQTVETSLGLDGKPTPNTDGYATIKSAYDASGNVVRRVFYGVNGAQVGQKDKHKKPRR